MTTKKQIIADWGSEDHYKLAKASWSAEYDFDSTQR